MAARSFSMDDQRRFADLSGDCNPLHLDPVAARRSLLGGAAVHGIHLLLWALDALASERDLRGFSRLRVQFERGVVVGEHVEAAWREHQNRLLGLISGPAGLAVRMSLVPADTAHSIWSGPVSVGALSCEEHEAGDLERRTGELPLALPVAWQTLFPRLAATFPAGIAAALLATTRLVGMQCPGLHSVYAGLDLACDTAAVTGGALSYRVTRLDERVRLLEMAVDAGAIRGCVTALLRPKPYAQKSVAELRGLVIPGEFAGQEAIVVGGSRGLGELAAKLLALGGARVTLTWNRGEADGCRIVNEAAALGLTIRAMRFDTAAPPDAEQLPPAPYTHLYYCATPRIPAGQPGRFNATVFANLVDVYVAGLARTAEWLTPRAVANASIWCPSTVFLNQPEPGFPEYIAAKACAEALCAQLSTTLAPLVFTADRLPRMATDQTQGLVETEIADGPATILASLRCVAAKSVRA